jgi:hypothetical protein
LNIRFTSSLTDQDENVIAPALLNAIVSLLDSLPLAYVIRIETSDTNVYQHTRPLAESPADEERRREAQPPRASAAIG